MMKYLCFLAISLLAFPAFVTGVYFKGSYGADELLNSIDLFPNVKIGYNYPNNGDINYRFRRMLNNDTHVSRAYHLFQIRYVLKGGQKLRSPHYNGQSRKEIFKDNLKFIFDHNVLSRIYSQKIFEMGVNKFADMHVDEFKEERLGLKIPEGAYIRKGKQFSYPPPDPVYNLTRNKVWLEERINFDWRDHDVITPVKDQQNCGASVMFALTSAIEAHHAICNYNEVVNLSEQAMIDCATPKNGYKGNTGCKKSTFPSSLKYALKHGLTTTNQYPYRAKKGKCKFDRAQPVVQLKGYRRVANSINDVKEAILYEGPVAIGIPLQKEFIFYHHGVYDKCRYSESIGEHAMAIVGYGEHNGDRSFDHYYLIKNQWGKDWGENGYVRFTQYGYNCGMERLVYSFKLANCNILEVEEEIVEDEEEIEEEEKKEEEEEEEKRVEEVVEEVYAIPCPCNQNNPHPP